MKIKSNDKTVMVVTSKIETFYYQAVLARNTLLSGIRNAVRKKISKPCNQKITV